ncbi:MAG: TIM-barrel domain-containing protein [Candidatus Fimadaptatus sp.]|jgi:alpha-D-xyloside xylohydrolase
MEHFMQCDNRLIFRCADEIVWVEPWGRDSLRVRAVVRGEIRDDRWALLDPDPCTAEIAIDGDKASIKNGGIEARIHRDGWNGTCAIEFFNARGELLIKEQDSHGALRLRAHEFDALAGGNFRLTASFEGSEDEHLYGMGQYQQERLDLKGCVLELAHRNSQASVPFVMSSRGYGMLWHCPAIGEVAFGSNVTRWVARSARQLDYWITAADTPAQIEMNYQRATGRPPMMPEFGLGFWQCKLRYWNQQQVLDVAREYKRRGLPIDVIVVDFFHWPHLGDFRFDEEFFPDPEGMARELREMGIELMVSVWPQISLKSENYEEMLERGLLIGCDKGVWVCKQFVEDSVAYDVTNPEARDYVWRKCKQNYFDKGARLYWLDEAEPEFSRHDVDIYRWHMGPHAEVGNLYPQLYTRGFYDGMREAGTDQIVNLVRCAWAGSQRYGALVWSGDIHSTWQDLRNQICAGLNMAVAGIDWWTTDIGGFHNGDIRDPRFRQLLVRWFEYGAFCPVMRLHGDRDPHETITRADGSEALFSGGDNEVWSFGEDNYEILRRYMLLREQMRPYLREIMRTAHEEGMPPMRPLFFDFPQDARCYEIKDEYMFGPDVLVAPICHEDAVSRRVFLPAGARWTQLGTGRVYDGGQEIEAEAPLDLIPVFLRDGSHADWKI